MEARITSTIRIKEGSGTRKYCPGDVAKGESAERAISEGCGVEIKQAAEPENKSERAPDNKSAKTS